jgi:hypothetical protein
LSVAVSSMAQRAKQYPSNASLGRDQGSAALLQTTPPHAGSAPQTDSTSFSRMAHCPGTGAGSMQPDDSCGQSVLQPSGLPYAQLVVPPW